MTPRRVTLPLPLFVNCSFSALACMAVQEVAEVDAADLTLSPSFGSSGDLHSPPPSNSSIDDLPEALGKMCVQTVHTGNVTCFVPFPLRLHSPSSVV